MNKDFDEIKQIMSQSLSEGRFQHVLGVVECAYQLAEQYGADPKKAALAALLHDCAKELKPQILLQEAERYELPLDKVDRSNPHLLHARVGAQKAKEYFAVHDENIVNAIASHTLGRPGMTLLEEILFLADAIEINRPSAWAYPIRSVLKTEGIKRAVLKTCQQSIQEVVSRQVLLHPLTVETYNFYLMSS